MARHETDRENLLEDATALVERIELAASAFDENVFIGFRKDGCGSIYFGQEPVYQFNSNGQLRRAFCDGLMLKAQRGRLVSLDRLRRSGEVQLVRRDLSNEEAQVRLDEMHELMGRLRKALADRAYNVVGQIPADTDLVGRVGRWLEEIAGAGIAQATRVM